MIDTLIGLGMFGMLTFIAIKVAVLNEISHEIRDLLMLKKEGGKE